MDAKIIIENLLSAIESGDKDDIEETVGLAKLMLPGLSAAPAMPDLTGKWMVLDYNKAVVVGVFDDQATADQVASHIDSTGGDGTAYEINITTQVQVVQPQQVTIPQAAPNPAPQGAAPPAAPVAAFCPDCGQQEDANGDCPDPGCSRNTYIPPGYVKSAGKHRPGSGLANKSLYSGGSGSNDTGVLR